MVGWHSIIAEEKSGKLQFTKTDLSTLYPPPAFCLLKQKNLPDKHYFGTLHRVFINFQSETQRATNVKIMEQ